MKATVTLCEQVNVGTTHKADMKVRPVMRNKAGQPMEAQGIVEGSRVNYLLRYSEDGRRITKSLGTADLKVAQLAHSTALARFTAGIRPIMGEAPLLTDFKTHAKTQDGATWRGLYHVFVADQEQKLVEGQITSSSQRRYLRSLKVLNSWFEPRVTFLSEINAELFDTFKRERIEAIRKENGTTGASYKLDVKTARMMFTLAVEKGWMVENPVKKAKAKKKRKGDEEGYGADPYSREELAAMREHLTWIKGNKQVGDDTLMFWLLYQTGLRRSDAGGLKWKEVDLEAGRIRTVALKNGRDIQVRIAPELRIELEKEIEERYKGGKPTPTDYVLFRYTPSNAGDVVYNTIVRLGARAGVKRATPHRFRDTFAAVCYLKGLSTEQVAAYLGDTVKVVEKHYSEFVKERQEQADNKYLNAADPMLQATS